MLYDRQTDPHEQVNLANDPAPTASSCLTWRRASKRSSTPKSAPNTRAWAGATTPSRLADLARLRRLADAYGPILMAEIWGCRVPVNGRMWRSSGGVWRLLQPVGVRACRRASKAPDNF